MPPEVSHLQAAVSGCGCCSGSGGCGELLRLGCAALCPCASMETLLHSALSSFALDMLLAGASGQRQCQGWTDTHVLLVQSGLDWTGCRHDFR